MRSCCGSSTTATWWAAPARCCRPAPPTPSAACSRLAARTCSPAHRCPRDSHRLPQTLPTTPHQTPPPPVPASRPMNFESAHLEWVDGSEASRITFKLWTLSFFVVQEKRRNARKHFTRKLALFFAFHAWEIRRWKWEISGLLCEDILLFCYLLTKVSFCWHSDTGVVEFMSLEFSWVWCLDYYFFGFILCLNINKVL